VEEVVGLLHLLLYVTLTKVLAEGKGIVVKLFLKEA